MYENMKLRRIFWLKT